MSALEHRLTGELVRRRLDCRPPVTAAIRSLAGCEAPFALVGDWAGGGAVLGAAPVRVAAAGDDPLELIAATSRQMPEAIGAAAVGGGWVGYLGYPLRHRVEQCDPGPPALRRLPPFALAYYDHVVRCDRDGTWWFETLLPDDGEAGLDERARRWERRLADPPPLEAAVTTDWTLEPSAAAHARLVAACRTRIHAGDLFQANLCARMRGRIDGAALDLFARGVEALSPARAAYVEGPWGAIVSLSPELFLERRGRTVRTAPIKGTRPRPPGRADAERERAALEASEKDRAENVMIVDLMRNDLGRVCEPGTVEAGPLAEVQPHAGVWHLVSEVRGTLRDDADDGDLLRATFPPGSVTGAPKIAAMNVIAELESSGRDVYTGAIGIASPALGLELNVAIRTFEVTGGEIRLGVGGGVVADSDPDAEARELATKAGPLLGAIGASHSARPAPAVAPPVRRLGPAPVPRPDRAAGVFTTLLVERGVPRHLDRHAARLSASVRALYGASLPLEALRREIEEAARPAPPLARLRVDARPGADGIDLGFALEALQPSGPARLRTWTLPGGLGRHKWADRRLPASMEAAGEGAQPLLVDADGWALETSRANLFVLGADGALRTPPADGRILPGVARELILERAARAGLRVLAEPVSLEAVHGARAVVLTSALRCTPVVAADDVALEADPALLETLRALTSG